jgi:predicted secreted protein
MAALKRPLHPMPDFVRLALEKADLMNKYQQRPAYQRNDYISWITRAKLENTKFKRLQQMLEELGGGVKYMGMDYIVTKSRRAP